MAIERLSWRDHSYKLRATTWFACFYSLIVLSSASLLIWGLTGGGGAVFFIGEGILTLIFALEVGLRIADSATKYFQGDWFNRFEFTLCCLCIVIFCSELGLEGAKKTVNSTENQGGAAEETSSRGLFDTCLILVRNAVQAFRTVSLLLRSRRNTDLEEIQIDDLDAEAGQEQDFEGTCSSIVNPDRDLGLLSPDLGADLDQWGDEDPLIDSNPDPEPGSPTSA